MLYPSINVLRTKVDSKYTLVSLAAKRARDLIDGKPPLVDIGIEKPVSVATSEIAEDLITYERLDDNEDEEELEESLEEEIREKFAELLPSDEEHTEDSAEL